MADMSDAAGLATVATTIGAAITPVFLLAGIGSILSVISTRLSRAVDRSRVIVRLHPLSAGEDHISQVAELRILDKRIARANLATSLCVMSALTTCLVIILLFIGQLTRLQFADGVAVLFVLTMLLLAGGLLAFLSEIRIALSSLRISEALLEREP